MSWVKVKPLVSLVLLGALACRQDAPPQAPLREAGRFVLEFDPAVGTVSSALHVDANLIQDGVMGGPTDSFELGTTNPRLQGVGGCPVGNNCFDVTARSFYDTETFQEVYLQIDEIQPSVGRAIANSDAPPVGSGLSPTAFGGRLFGTIGPGGAVLREIRISVPDNTRYWVAGRLYHRDPSSGPADAGLPAPDAAAPDASAPDAATPADGGGPGAGGGMCSGPPFTPQPYRTCQVDGDCSSCYECVDFGAQSECAEMAPLANDRCVNDGDAPCNCDQTTVVCSGAGCSQGMSIGEIVYRSMACTPHSPCNDLDQATCGATTGCEYVVESCNGPGTACQDGGSSAPYTVSYCAPAGWNRFAGFASSAPADGGVVSPDATNPDAAPPADGGITAPDAAQPADGGGATTPENCLNLDDDDGNGLADCADPACSGTAACTDPDRGGGMCMGPPFTARVYTNCNENADCFGCYACTDFGNHGECAEMAPLANNRCVNSGDAPCECDQTTTVCTGTGCAQAMSIGESAYRNLACAPHSPCTDLDQATCGATSGCEYVVESCNGPGTACQDGGNSDPYTVSYCAPAGWNRFVGY